MQQFGHEVGAAGRNQNGVSLATQVDMRHVVVLARIPLRIKYRAIAQRLHGHRRDELRGGLGHHDLHGGPLLDQRTAQLSRLIAGNATCQTQNNVLTGKVHVVLIS